MSAGCTHVRRPWALIPVLLLASVLGGCWGTNSPTVVFDPNRPGGGGGGGTGGGEPLPDGSSAAPTDGTLLLAGAPLLEATAPLDGAVGIDVRAPVALWFSESLRTATAGSQTVFLRPVENPLASVAYQRIWLVGDRLLVLAPSAPLAADTEYEVVLSNGITDLDGKRYDASDGDGVVLRFQTAGQATGVAPRVLGSFPPDGAPPQPNDPEAVLVFSKSINFTGITDAVTLTNETTSLEAGYDRVAGSANRYAGDRVIAFPHLDDAVDLGATVRLDVSVALTDTEFLPQSLQAPWTARWSTLGFARPAAVVPVDVMPSDPFPAAVNLFNLEAFPVDVSAGPGMAAADALTLRVHDQLLATGTLQTQAAGTGTPRYTLDLTDPVSGDPLFLPQADLVLGAYAERGGRRTTVRVAEDAAGALQTVVHDLVPPVLFQYGPPYGQFGSQFVTDLPELRPLGTASEPIARIITRVPPGGTGVPRDVFTPSASSAFLGSAFPRATVTEGPVAFDIQLTDRAGNPSLVASPGSAVFRGFVSTQTLTGSGGALRVVAFDRDALQVLPGAQVWVQDAGGGNEAAATTGSNGAALFSGRSGLQTVTVAAPGYHAVTLHGSDGAVLSLPLVSSFPIVASATTTFDGVNTGTVTVSGTTLAESSSGPDPAAAQDFDLGAGLFGAGVAIGLQRPGWYAAFHEVADFPASTYLRLVGLEPRVLVDAATGTSVPTLQFPMRESMNEVAATSDYVYPLHVTPGAGFDNPVEELRVLMTTAIPGLGGQAAVGAGSMAVSNANPNAGVELELGLHGDALLEGADPATVYVHVYGRDADGELAIAREPVAVLASPATTSISLPDLPEATAAWLGTGYPYTRTFSDSLGGGPGWYRMVIRDSQSQAAEWHVWIAAGSAGGGSFTLPTLASTPGGPVGTPPLTTAPGATWRAHFEAFSMPAGYGVTGFYFRELYRDFLGWARAAQGPALAF